MEARKKSGFWKIRSAALLSCAILATSAHAAKFANQFIEFELPPQWQCALEGSEWVCQNTNESKKRDAIIVLAAKLKGDQDSLDQYLAYLKQPKSYTSVQGKPIQSEAKYAKSMSINDQNWVDALHLESEIPGFYTRYLATVKQDIGVLVTYSINKTKYSQYLSDFENMVKTLKVFRKPGLGLNANTNSNIFSNTQIPSGVSQDTVYGTVNPQGGSDSKPAPSAAKSNDEDDLFLIVGVIAAVAGFIVWKKRRGR